MRMAQNLTLAHVCLYLRFPSKLKQNPLNKKNCRVKTNLVMRSFPRMLNQSDVEVPSHSQRGHLDVSHLLSRQL